VRLVSAPRAFATTTCQMPLSASDVGTMATFGLAACSTTRPSRSQAYVSGYPVARTPSTATPPTSTSAAAGCRKIAGGTVSRTDSQPSGFSPSSDATMSGRKSQYRLFTFSA
jgi:hypothetical protein